MVGISSVFMDNQIYIKQLIIVLIVKTFNYLTKLFNVLVIIFSIWVLDYSDLLRSDTLFKFAKQLF